MSSVLPESSPVGSFLKFYFIEIALCLIALPLTFAKILQKTTASVWWHAFHMYVSTMMQRLGLSFFLCPRWSCDQLIVVESATSGRMKQTPKRDAELGWKVVEDIYGPPGNEE